MEAVFLGRSCFQKIILLPFPEKVFPVHADGQKQREKFCHWDSEPGSADPKKLRQDQQRDRGKYQGSLKGDDRGYPSVRQCGKESGGKDIKAAEQEVDGKQLKAGDSLLIGFRIVGKDGDDAGGKENGRCSHKYRNDCGKQEGNTVNVFQLRFLSCAILEADHRADADGKAKIKGLEQKLPVQKNGNGSNSVRSGQTPGFLASE